MDCIAHQAPLSMGFSRQEYWSGLPFPSPGDLPDPGIEARSPALQADSLPSELTGKTQVTSLLQVQTWSVCEIGTLPSFLLSSLFPSFPSSFLPSSFPFSFPPPFLPYFLPYFLLPFFPSALCPCSLNTAHFPLSSTVRSNDNMNSWHQQGPPSWVVSSSPSSLHVPPCVF